MAARYVALSSMTSTSGTNARRMRCRVIADERRRTRPCGDRARAGRRCRPAAARARRRRDGWLRPACRRSRCSASSCATVMPPARRMASSPSAPSRPIPVSSTPIAVAAALAAPPIRTARRPTAGTSAAARVPTQRHAVRPPPTRCTIGRRHDHARRRSASPSCLAMRTGTGDCSRQPLDEAGGERLADVRDDEDRRSNCRAAASAGCRRSPSVRRSRRRWRRARGPSRAACRCDRPRGARSPSSPRSRAARVGDDPDPRRPRAPCRPAAAPTRSSDSSAPRLLDHVERAGRQRVVGAEHFAAVGRARHDDDRRRAERHDVLGGGQAADHRHHHVERDDVGPQRQAQLDRPLAVGGFADDGHVGLPPTITPTIRRRTVVESSATSTLIGSANQPPDGVQEHVLIELALDDVRACAGVRAPRRRSASAAREVTSMAGVRRQQRDRRASRATNSKPFMPGISTSTMNRS